MSRGNGQVVRAVWFVALAMVRTTAWAQTDALYGVWGDENDVVGSSVAAAGDVNVDGYPDVIIGAAQTANKTTAGYALVVSGRDGTVLLDLQGPQGDTATYYGISVSGVGDLDGDGHAEVAVGAAGAEYLPTIPGYVDIFSGATGVLMHRILDPNANPSDRFAHALVGGEDVDGDGFPDLVVGTYAGSKVYVFSGIDFTLQRVWTRPVYFGRALDYAGDINGDGLTDIIVGDCWNEEVTLLSGVDGSTIRVHDGDDFDIDVNFGESVAGLGDVNGDEVDDYIIGSRSTNVNTVGHAYAISGNDGATLLSVSGLQRSDYFAWSVAGPGDTNGDGTPDLLVGAPYRSICNDGLASIGRGAAYVYSGVDGALLREEFGGGLRENLGYIVTGVGDVNQDGLADLAAAAPGASLRHWGSQGRVDIFPGRPDRDPRAWDVSGPGEWRVDCNGAADFLDIQEAVDHAADGDVIWVSTGTYFGFTVDNRSLRILREGQQDFQVASQVTIQNVPAGKQVAIHGLLLEVSVQLIVADCPGEVVLDSVVTKNNVYDARSTAQAQVVNSQNVILASGALNTSAGDDHASAAALLVDRSQLRWSSTWLHGPSGFNQGESGAPGIRVLSGSRVVFSHPFVVGGTGNIAGDGGEGVRVEAGGELVVVGGSTDTITGGESEVGGLGGDGAVVDGSLVLSPDIILQGGSGPSGNGLPWSGTGVVELRAMPQLEVLGDFAPGAVVTIRVESPMAGSYDLLVSDRSVFDIASGNGGPPLFVAPSDVFSELVELGSVGAGGKITTTFVLPENLPGRPLHFQAALRPSSQNPLGRRDTGLALANPSSSTVFTNAVTRILGENPPLRRFADCNGNGQPDGDDIARERSFDCNRNGIPDECAVELDCNGNLRPDACDIADGTSFDCNHNGIPDECEPDCDGNGVPDDCDLATGLSLDCNRNSIPDECESDADCNGNGQLDACDVLSGASADVDRNGVPDECQGTLIRVPSQYATIQDALNAAVDGGIVLVASGVYKGTMNRDLTFLGKKLSLISEEGPLATVIDCESAGRGFGFVTGEPPGTLLQGFTIQNGSVAKDGGGILVSNAEPTIQDCIIRNCVSNNDGNNVGNGGGICVYNDLGGRDKTRIERCQIVGNAALPGTLPTVGQGGGVWVAGYPLTILDSVIADNSAVRGGGIMASGLLYNGNYVLGRCTIVRNRASLLGGGLDYLDDVQLDNTILWQNQAPENPNFPASNSTSRFLVRHCLLGDTFPQNTNGYAVDLGGNLYVDPLLDVRRLLADPSLPVFHLRSDSPCIDAGDPEFVLPLFATDIDGDPRVANGRIDIGADEVVR